MADGWLRINKLGEELFYRIEGEFQPEPGDVNGDSKTNIFDLLELLGVLSEVKDPPSAADLDRNDIVNIFDLLELLKLLCAK